MPLTQTLVIPTNTVQVGDKIIAVDGHRVPADSCNVTEVCDRNLNNDGTVHVKVEQASTAYSTDRYLRFGSVTVERIKRVRRTFAGVRFYKTVDGWETADGKYAVEFHKDTGTTECEDAHPVRFSAERKLEIRKAISSWGIGNVERGTKGTVSYEEARAVQENKKGYLCPGGCIHVSNEWIAYKNTADRSENIAFGETATEAAHAVADDIRKGL